MSIKDLNKIEVGALLDKFILCDLEKESIEKLIRFAEFNHQMLETRISSLWGKDNMLSLYVGFIKGCENALEHNGDIRFANILLKLSTTKIYRKLLQCGAIKKSHSDILNEDLA